MRQLVLLAALVLAVGAAWFYLRTPSARVPSVEPLAPEVARVDAPRVTEGADLVRPDEPAPRVEPVLPPAPAKAEPQPAMTEPVPPVAVTPDALELLTLEEERLRKTLSELATPILQRKFENGEAVYVGDKQSYQATKADNALIYSVHMVPEGGTFRSEITRAERPDLYVMKDRMLAINAEIATIQRERALASAAAK